MNEGTDQQYKEHQVRKVMRVNLGMSYKKIQEISLHTNSARNLVLRQRFAMVLVSLLSQGKRVINIDESWLGMSDF